MLHFWYEIVALSLVIQCVLHECITAVLVLHQAPARKRHWRTAGCPAQLPAGRDPSFPLLLPGLARVLSSHSTADIAALHRRYSLGSRLRV